MNKYKHKLSTLSILFAIATGIIHIANKIIIASASLKNTVSTPQLQTYSWRFGNIAFTKQGSGTPLLLIHDLQSGLSSHEWNKVRNSLSKNYEVYTLDLLGCGHSDKPRITYTNFLYVQLICDFIKNIIKKETDVIASGYSCSFLTMACRNEPKLFHKIFFVNPPDFKVLNEIPSKNSIVQKFLLEIPIIGTMIYNIFMSRQNIDHTFSEDLFFNPFRIDSEFLDIYYENAHLNDCSGKYLYASKIGKYTNINIHNCLRESNHSIYILEGIYEKEGKKISKEYTDCNPAIETAFIKHAKHFPHIENPEEFLKQIDILL